MEGLKIMEWLNNNSTLVTIGLYIIGTVVSIVYASARFKEKVKTNEKEIEGIKTDLKENSDLKVSVSKNESDIKETRTVFKIRGDLSQLIGRFDTFFKMYIDNNSKEMEMADSQSPLNLTEFGKDTAKYIDAEKIIQNHWNMILEKIKEGGISPKSNPYDIQYVCFEIGDNYEKIISEKDLDIIKRKAYDKGHPTSSYTIVFSILIRNRYFQENNLNTGHSKNKR